MKQYHRYRMDFDSNWLRWSASCVGASIFLLAVYHLGFQYLDAPGSIIWDLWLPFGLGMVYIVLLQGIRLNAPGLYAILGVFMCLFLMICVFATGDVLRIILAVIAYPVCGAALILCAGGFLPGRLPASVCFGVVLAVRLLCYDFGHITGAAWLTELAHLGFIASLFCLPIGMIPGKSVCNEENQKESAINE